MININSKLFLLEIMEGSIREYLESDSKQHYYSSDEQKLLGDPELAQLNDKGKQLYAEVLEKVKQSIFKCEIQDADVKNSRSGCWADNPVHPYYVNVEPIEVSIRLCNMDNAYVSGVLNGFSISTSSLIFITKDWVYTRSGSLYKINNYVKDYCQISEQCMRPAIFKFF